MNTSRFLGRAFLAGLLAAGLSGTAMAAEPHAHAGHAAPAASLKLDNGMRWETDAPLRAGMIEIREAMAASLESIHAGAFAPTDYDALAARLEQQIDYVTTNCHLPEAADAELHVVLGQIIDGIDAMRGGPDRDQGAVKVVEALDLYAKGFDHPAWKPLSH